MFLEDRTNYAAYETAARLAKVQRENTHAVLTYEATTQDEKHGTCIIKIYRAIGNDSGCKVEMTRQLLAKYEPKVGLWHGDRFEYWKDGKLLETRYE